MNETKPLFKFHYGKYNLHCNRCDTTIKSNLTDKELREIKESSELYNFWCPSCQIKMKKIEK